MPLIRLNRAATILAWLAGVPVAAQSTPSIPVIPGLTIVKAISNPDADYETLVQVEKVDSTAIHLLVRFPPREARQRGAAGRAARNDDLRTHRRTVRRVDMAGALIAALPTVAVYVLAGRYFVRGLTAGAVKG